MGQPAASVPAAFARRFCARCDRRHAPRGPTYVSLDAACRKPRSAMPALPDVARFNRRCSSFESTISAAACFQRQKRGHSGRPRLPRRKRLKESRRGSRETARAGHDRRRAEPPSRRITRCAVPPAAFLNDGKSCATPTSCSRHLDRYRRHAATGLGCRPIGAKVISCRRMRTRIADGAWTIGFAACRRVYMCSRTGSASFFFLRCNQEEGRFPKKAPRPDEALSIRALANARSMGDED